MLAFQFSHDVFRVQVVFKTEKQGSTFPRMFETHKKMKRSTTLGNREKNRVNKKKLDIKLQINIDVIPKEFQHYQFGLINTSPHSGT